MKALIVQAGPLSAHDRVVFLRREIPLVRQLAADGVQTIVALLGDAGGVRADMAAAAADVTVLPLQPSPAAGIRTLPGALVGLRAFIDRHAPIVVDASDPLAAIATALAVRGRDRRTRPVVLYRRHFYLGRLQNRCASRLAARLSDRCVASCESTRRFFAEADRTPIRDIDIASSGIAEPPALDPREVASARQALDIADSAFVIAVVAKLSWRKGVDVLIRAIDRLHAQQPSRDIHLIVVGNGQAEAGLRRQAAGVRAPIHWLGSRDDVHRWMAASDVIVMPSRGECFGRVTLEAMSLGRPLVASRVGGLQDAVVDGETGLLVPVGDAHALAEALASLARDPERLKRMGEAARARFESHYTITHMATSWRRAWERAVSDRH